VHETRLSNIKARRILTKTSFFFVIFETNITTNDK